MLNIWNSNIFVGLLLYWRYFVLLVIFWIRHRNSFHFNFLAYTILTIVISFKYSSTSNSACFLLVIPSTSRKMNFLFRVQPLRNLLFSHRSICSQYSLFSIGCFSSNMFVCRYSSLDDTKKMVSSKWNEQNETSIRSIK